MSFPLHRPRRLRRSAAMRRLVAETRLHPAELILPAFIKEGAAEPVPIASMPGVVQHTADSLKAAGAEAAPANSSLRNCWRSWSLRISSRMYSLLVP